MHEAVRRIDATNNADPVTVTVDGVARPRALLYGMRMTEWLKKLAPEASIPLQLAARAQHIGRWRTPRTDYPAGRAGYLAWRRAAGAFHADTVSAILEAVEFDGPVVQRVQSLVRKQHLKTDDEAQILEDVACLVFLAYELEEFAGKHPRDKVVHILQRTWKKMSSGGRAAAASATLPPSVALLVREATAVEP